MERRGIRRYIGVTGGSLTIEGDRKSLTNRLGALLFRMLYPGMIEDKTKELAVLRSSDVDWTLVRLPFVSEGGETGDWKVNLADMPGYRINNADIARFLVRQIEDRAYVGKTPFIAN